MKFIHLSHALKTIKILDLISDYLERKIMKNEDKLLFLKGIGKKYTDNEIFNKSHENILSNYKPSEKKVGLFTVCSWGKPYRQSYIHYMIISELIKNNLFDKIELIVLTNAGVIPYGFTDEYPYFAYDWDPNLETPEIKKIYIKILKKRLEEFLNKKSKYFIKFCCYLRHSSESFKVVKNIEEEFKILIPNFAINEKEIRKEEYDEISLGFYDDHDIYLVTKRSLNNLTTSLKKFL
ncbi:MAG: hypothetical protein EAX96_09110 [Candidatus Lokiarchaeota archaeon]|nr:hypothetical protein [Candidatus Lokiarchaeota archaeon]